MENIVKRKPRGRKIKPRKGAEKNKHNEQLKPSRPGRKIGYMRVSTKEQENDLQRDALIAAGVEPGDIFQDKISGKTTSRPGLDSCKKFLVPGDTLIVWRLDRLGRKVIMLKTFVQDLIDRQISFLSIRENLDLSTPAGRAMFGMMCVFAEMEREVISERVTAGIKAKMDAGRKRWGKAPAVDYNEDEIIRMIRQKKTQREISKLTGVSKTTVQRISKAMREEKKCSLKPKT